MIKLSDKHESYGVDNKEQPISSGENISHKKKQIVLIGALLLGVIIIILIVVWLMNNKGVQNSTTSSTSTVQVLQAESVCPANIINEANVPIANSDQVALGAVVDKITMLKDYDHDPNCLYITLQYALAGGNATQSTDYMDKLKQVFDPAIGYSSAFTVTLVPLSTLSTSVNFLVQNAKDGAANASGLDKSAAAGSTAADKFHEGQK